MRKIRLKRQGRAGLDSLLERDLNPAQIEAATAPDGYNLILAGPGSGKTRVITYRVAHLISRGIAPQSILLLTFTRRAAREMTARLTKLVGATSQAAWAGTFHHVGNRLLRRHAPLLGLDSGFTILDSEDQQELVSLALQDAGLVGLGRLAPTAPRVHQLISLSFNTVTSFEQVIESRAPEWVEHTAALVAAAQAYQVRKRASQSVDFDDLLGLWGRLLREHPKPREQMSRQFRHILIDELQDTNRVQSDLVEALAQTGAGNLTAVGDDAQSIYGFRGADHQHMRSFPDRHQGARVYRLDTNYRSSPQIVALLNEVLAHQTSGFERTLTSACPTGIKPLVVAAGDPFEEAEVIAHQVLEAIEEGVSPREMAVLYRNHHDSILIQQELVNRGILYEVRSGMRFFEQAHIKDVLAHARILINPRDELAWRRLLKLLPGIGNAKASQIYGAIAAAAEPFGAIRSREMMQSLPVKSRGPFAALVGDFDRLRGLGPEAAPSAVIAAVLETGFAESVRTRFDNPESRLADIEQLALLAGRYATLGQFLADLQLAADIESIDAASDTEEQPERLVLSTIHQAKGLEWDRVWIPRLVEDSFPSARSVAEPGGEDEERRVFYVAVSRARRELTLAYPLLLMRPGRDGRILARPSRFLEELDPELYEVATVMADDGGAEESTGPLAAETPLPAEPGD